MWSAICIAGPDAEVIRSLRVKARDMHVAASYSENDVMGGSAAEPDFTGILTCRVRQFPSVLMRSELGVPAPGVRLICVMSKRPFGEIEAVLEGSTFPSREALSAAGVHRPTRAGISGAAKEGADSLVLSEGYQDDEDFGDVIVYTGHGGRDPNSGEQVADQTFTRGNAALPRNKVLGLPVRVVRGFDGRRFGALFERTASPRPRQISLAATNLPAWLTEEV